MMPDDVPSPLVIEAERRLAVARDKARIIDNPMDPNVVARRFGIGRERADLGDYEVMGSVAAPSYEGDGVLPVDNLAPEDGPAWTVRGADNDDAVLERSVEALLEAFQSTELARRETIDRYNQVSDPALREKFTRMEPAFENAERRCAFLKKIVVARQNLPAARKTSIPSAVPDRSKSYPGAIEDRDDWSESSQPFPIVAGRGPDLPVRRPDNEKRLAQVKATMAILATLNHDYRVATTTARTYDDRGEEWMPEFAPSPFDEASTTGSSARAKPPEWMTGKVPPPLDPRKITLTDLAQTHRVGGGSAVRAGDFMTREVPTVSPRLGAQTSGEKTQLIRKQMQRRATEQARQREAHARLLEQGG